MRDKLENLYNAYFCLILLHRCKRRIRDLKYALINSKSTQSIPMSYLSRNNAEIQGIKKEIHNLTDDYNRYLKTYRILMKMEKEEN